MRSLPCAALLALAGCATTIPSMRDGQPYATLGLSREPLELAECARGKILELGTEADIGTLSATPVIQEGADRVMLVGHNPHGVPYFADLFPDGPGTRVMVYSSTGYGGHQYRGDLIVRILRRCG